MRVVYTVLYMFTLKLHCAELELRWSWTRASWTRGQMHYSSGLRVGGVWGRGGRTSRSCPRSWRSRRTPRVHGRRVPPLAALSTQLDARATRRERERYKHQQWERNTAANGDRYVSGSTHDARSGVKHEHTSSRVASNGASDSLTRVFHVAQRALPAFRLYDRLYTEMLASARYRVESANTTSYCLTMHVKYVLYDLVQLVIAHRARLFPRAAVTHLAWTDSGYFRDLPLPVQPPRRPSKCRLCHRLLLPTLNTRVLQPLPHLEATFSPQSTDSNSPHLRNLTRVVSRSQKLATLLWTRYDSMTTFTSTAQYITCLCSINL